MASSLSNAVDNIAEEINKIKCNCGHDNINVNCVELNTKIVSAVLDTPTLKLI